MSNSAPRTALGSSIVPCVQSFDHQQHLRSCAASLSRCSLFQRHPSFQAVATRFSKLQTRACFGRSKPAIVVISNFAQPAHFDAKMATPETFSETESETMYEKARTSVLLPKRNV